MKPQYKQIKCLAPHCPECKEQLMGNNSSANPWTCSCGTWDSSGKYPWDGNYEIHPHPREGDNIDV